jgi:ABC-type amino acid transport substrate-binding protein
MEKGDIDLALMVSYTTERANYGFFSIPYRKEQMRLFSVKTPTPIKDLRTLLDDSKTIGLSIGSYYGEEIEALANDAQYQSLMVSISSAQRRAEMLIKNRVDFIIEDLITGLYIKSISENNNIGPWPYIVHDNQVHFLLRRTQQHMRLMDEINASIAKLRPQIDKLVRNYSRLD